MIQDNQHLHPDIFTPRVPREYVRNGYGEGLREIGEKNEQVVALCADLAESTRTHLFKEAFPDRYVELGVAEQNLATVASGMAAMGKIPFIASYAAFNPGRNNEQIRTTIAINDVHVVIMGCHAGVSVGPDGATHQALEDIALMRAMPNMTVVAPADKEECRKAVHEATDYKKPIYIRFGRPKYPVITTEKSPFEIGKANILWESKEPQVALIGCGPLVHNALLSAKKLEEEGVGSIVINNHTIKPLDEKIILGAVKKVKAVVTIEEHQRVGGMGSAVAELLAQKHPLPVRFIGVDDQFGQSGSPDELLAHYGMDVSTIMSAVHDVLK